MGWRPMSQLFPSHHYSIYHVLELLQYFVYPLSVRNTIKANNESSSAFWFSAMNITFITYGYFTTDTGHCDMVVLASAREAAVTGI